MVVNSLVKVLKVCKIDGPKHEISNFVSVFLLRNPGMYTFLFNVRVGDFEYRKD
jgi:hypothetical protein